MTKIKTVLIWGKEDLLSSSIEHFLAAHKNWNVISVLNTGDLEALIQAVASKHPDIVIIHQGDRYDPASLPLKILQDHPALKVITVSLEDNAMEVYNKKKILIRAPSDLTTAIEDSA